MNKSALTLALAFCAPPLFAQTYLTADGQTDTYSLINSVLAPGGNATETPDCSHPSFGPHITQAYDVELAAQSFVFHIHVTPDDDRCVAFDRQRNEIKTYGPSPAYLKGFFGDTVTYRWKFRLDAGFQPSPNFTHVHQIKAGDGSNADAPIFTLTPRAGSPDKLELIHVNSAGVTTKVQIVDLAGFEGEWVEAYEKVTYTDPGAYSIQVRRLRDGLVLLSYANNNIETWRTGGTTFVRPKWGIYRSLNSSSYLRDEQVRFNRFCLAKGADDCPAEPGPNPTPTPPPPPPPPAAPTGLTATAGTKKKINLAWTASAGSASYNVKRATASGGPYSVIASAVATTFTNTGLTSGTTYCYVVSAVNSSGESGNSNEACATAR